MRNGFEFNGKNTTDFKRVTVRTKDRPVFPQVKEFTENVNETDGEYDFTDVSGHEYFNTRKFQIDFNIGADSTEELNKKLTAISRWFKGKGTLIFNDTPCVKWNVRVIDDVSYMPENSGKKAVLSVTYKAKPFSELIFDALNGPCLDTDISLDTEIPIGQDEYLTLNGNGTYKNIPNIGDVHVKPIITVTGAKSPFTISNNGKSITVKYTGDIVIDCEKEIVYSENTSLMTDISGDFFELVPGLDNTITVTGGGVVQINYTPKFLYDVDFDNVKWSE